MDNDTDGTSETDAQISAPRGCDACVMGVELDDVLTIRACASCSHTARGHRTDHEAAGLVFESLAALEAIRELLWPMANPNGTWSPDTIEAIARRFDFLRTEPNYPAAEAVRYSGSVRIELTYQDSDGCYDGKVVVGGHTYGVSVGPPASGYGPGVAYDSPEAYDRAAPRRALIRGSRYRVGRRLRHLHAGGRGWRGRLGDSPASAGQSPLTGAPPRVPRERAMCCSRLLRPFRCRVEVDDVGHAGRDLRA